MRAHLCVDECQRGGQASSLTEAAPSGAAESGVMYLGLADLVARWVYTRQGVHRLMRREGFPAPAFAINRGRTKVWRRADIEAYELAHPELTDEAMKLSKVRGYCIAVGRGQQAKGAVRATPPDAPEIELDAAFWGECPHR